MARRPRLDVPGAWFHVMNRGIARRVVFPDALHGRLFLAWAVRRGEIEVRGQTHRQIRRLWPAQGRRSDVCHQEAQDRSALCAETLADGEHPCNETRSAAARRSE
jgi:hypothetical protein